MKIPKKQELQQLHSSDIDFKDFMNLYIKCTAKSYFFSDSHYSCIKLSFAFLEKLFDQSRMIEQA